MAVYQRSPVLGTTNPEHQDLLAWLERELDMIASALREKDPFVLTKLSVAPARPRDGLIAFADGTNWNPGSGTGIYAYYGGSWHKLG